MSTTQTPSKFSFSAVLLLFIVSLASMVNSGGITAQTAEIQAAVEYLNRVRANPNAFSDEIGVPLHNAEPLHALTWNTSLGAAAQRKAEDMARRGYFDHVDPEGYGMNYFIAQAGYELHPLCLQDRSDNFWESIAAGSDSPTESIIQLINDGVNSTDLTYGGHRVHLLGMGDNYANCEDIGIGFARNPNSRYRYYCVVLIAKHTLR